MKNVNPKYFRIQILHSILLLGLLREKLTRTKLAQNLNPVVGGISTMIEMNSMCQLSNKWKTWLNKKSCHHF